MIRWVLGVALIASMAASGYLVLRPRVNRPVLEVRTLLPAGPSADDLRRGLGLALQERDHRGGAFQVVLKESEGNGGFDDDDRWHDLSNSSYGHLGFRFGGWVPGLARTSLRRWSKDSPDLLPLSPVEDGRSAARALESLAVRSAAVVSCHSPDPAAPDDRTHLHWNPAIDVAARTLLTGSRSAEILRSLPLNVRGVRKQGPVEDLAGRILEADPEWVYADLRSLALPLIERLRERGYPGEILVPSGNLSEALLLAPAVEGSLTLLAKLRPPPEDFVRRSGSSNRLSWAGYRCGLRFLDWLDRLKAKTEHELWLAWEGAPKEPFLDPAVATIGVYRIRAGRFELVQEMP